MAFEQFCKATFLLLIQDLFFQNTLFAEVIDLSILLSINHTTPEFRVMYSHLHLRVSKDVIAFTSDVTLLNIALHTWHPPPNTLDVSGG